MGNFSLANRTIIVDAKNREHSFASKYIPKRISKGCWGRRVRIFVRFFSSSISLSCIGVDLTRYPFHYAEQEVDLFNEEQVGRPTLIGRRKLKAGELNSVAKNRRPCSFQAVPPRMPHCWSLVRSFLHL